MVPAALVAMAALAARQSTDPAASRELASARARDAYFATLERQSSIINDGPAEEWGEGTAFPTRAVPARSGEGGRSDTRGIGRSRGSFRGLRGSPSEGSTVRLPPSSGEGDPECWSSHSPEVARNSCGVVGRNPRSAA